MKLRPAKTSADDQTETQKTTKNLLYDVGLNTSSRTCIQVHTHSQLIHTTKPMTEKVRHTQTNTCKSCKS
jgi:hypothetical protein